MKFDMNKVWSHAVELIGDNFQLLATIAAVFLLLPTVAIYMLIPDFATMMAPGTDPEVLAAQMEEFIGPLIGIGLVGMVFQFAGYGAMVALMGSGRPTVGQALGAGFKMVPSLIIATLLFALIYFVGAFLISLPFSFLAVAAESVLVTFIAVIFVLVFVVYLMARFSLIMPVMAFEETLNPFIAISRSFKLTGPSHWRIFAFWGVLLVLYVVAALLLGGVFGVVAALAAEGVVAALILGLTNGAMATAVGMVACALVAAMHIQLAGPGDAEISETFE